MTLQFKPEPKRHSWRSHDSWARSKSRSIRLYTDRETGQVTVCAINPDGVMSMNFTAADARAIAAELIAAAESLAVQAPVDAEQPA